MKSLMPQIDSNDGLFHNGNPATGEQGTRVTDTWLNNLQDRVRDVQAEAHYVLQKAGFRPVENKQTQLYEAIVKIIDDNRKTASLTQKGEVQLSSSTNSDSETQAATSKAAKTAYDKAVEAKTAADNAQRTADSKQSPATTLAGYGIDDLKIQSFAGDINTLKIDGIYAITQAGRSQNLPVSTSCHIQVIAGGDGSWCRQLAYVAYSTDMYERHQTSYQTDSWSAWKKLNTDGIPVGTVVSFPRVVTNPVGFLKANGTTFNQQTFPDLYQVLGNSNQLPDLTRRSDVGMTAYFAVDNIPTGWIAFDEIATQVTEQRYPELYRHLIGKYGSIDGVPKVADRFLRNAGNGLSVGQIQEDEFKSHSHYLPAYDDNQDRRYYDVIRDGTPYAGYVLGRDSGGGDVQDNPFIRSKSPHASTGGDETRPKSLILKLCIKAINNFDDVVFWIKSHGEITNAGALDAGRLAQGLQDKADRNHTHTVSQITDFNQITNSLIANGVNQAFSERFTQQWGDSGWCKLPNGLILQWGRLVNGGYGTKARFPITFPHGVLSISLTNLDESGWDSAPTVTGRNSITISGFDYRCDAQWGMFLAIGY